MSRIKFTVCVLILLLLGFYVQILVPLLPIYNVTLWLVLFVFFFSIWHLDQVELLLFSFIAGLLWDIQQQSSQMFWQLADYEKNLETLPFGSFILFFILAGYIIQLIRNFLNFRANKLAAILGCGFFFMVYFLLEGMMTSFVYGEIMISKAWFIKVFLTSAVACVCSVVGVFCFARISRWCGLVNVPTSTKNNIQTASWMWNIQKRRRR